MIYIIADDLTGASDTGVQYKRRGLRTLISAEIDLDQINTLSDEFDVISINADTRAKFPQDAYNMTYNLVKHIKNKEYKYIYKKVDSVLRGNVAQELEAMMDAMNVPLAVVAISYPENGRTLCNGVLTISNTNSIKSGIDAIKVFSDGMNVKVQGIGIEVVREGKEALMKAVASGCSEGGQVFVIDAVTDEDLAIVRDASLAVERKMILCGSAGLAKQLSLLEPREEKGEAAFSKKDGITLVMIGSYNTCTAEQVQTLVSETGIPLITVFTRDILAGKNEMVNQEISKQADDLISGGCRLLAVVVDTLLPGYIDTENDRIGIIKDSLSITNAMGCFARQFCERYAVNAIVSSGGDTSLAILNALNANGIELEAEIVSGVPVGQLVGGIAEGIAIVTKSGGFGKKDCLVRSIEYLDRNI
jgi:uncharacterized protein YgbK (DUF1537 family)